MVGDRPEVVLVDVPGVAVEVLQRRLVAGGAAADQRVPVQVAPVQLVVPPLDLVALLPGRVRPAPRLLPPVGDEQGDFGCQPVAAGAGGRDDGEHHLPGAVHAVPDHRAVVVGQVRALAAAEPLGPVQGAVQPPVGLGGQHHPGRRWRPATPPPAWRRCRRTWSAAPAVRPEHLDRGLPVVGHQRQLPVDPVPDDQAAVRGGLQPRHRRGGDVEPAGQLPGRLTSSSSVDAHHPDARAHLGQQLGRHARARLRACRPARRRAWPSSGRGRSRVGPLPPWPVTVITSNAHHNRPSAVVARLGCRA